MGIDRGVLAGRFRAQLLVGRPARAPEDVADALLAIQSQDLRGAFLAIRARSAGLSAADVRRALDDRRLVVNWLQRGTLHLVRPEDHMWLHPLLSPSLATGNRRRLRQEGVTEEAAERGVRAIVEAVTQGPRTRGELREVLDAQRVPTKGQALIHMLALASLRGHILRGPMVRNEQAWVSASAWIGEPAPLERAQALAMLAERYLRGHGPATDRDLAKWSGLPLRDVRAGLEASARHLRLEGDLWDLKGAARSDGRTPPPKVLGSYEPLLLGWASRGELFASLPADLITSNGLFRPFSLVDGKIAGRWTLDRGTIAFEHLVKVGKKDQQALIEDAEDVLRFLAGR